MPTVTSPFTDTAIERIAPPTAGRLYVSNPRVPGLRLIVTPAGAKTWWLNRRIAGKPTKFRIGSFPEVSPDKAKSIAADMLGQIERDVNPRDEQDRKKTMPTFGEVFSKWMESKAKIGKRTWKEDQRKFDRMIPDSWKTRAIKSITTADVDRLKVDVVNRVRKKREAKVRVRLGVKAGATLSARQQSAINTAISRAGQTLANRILELIATVYSFAIDVLEVETKNPATKVEEYREHPRERWFEDNELKALFAALNDHARPVVADAIRFVAFTGQRKGEVLKARWSEFDLDRRVWTIPIEHHKGKRLHRVSLPEPALDILRRRKAEAPAGIEWVFPASRVGRAKPGEQPPTEIGPCTILHREWTAICKAAGIDGVTIHDLRRTFGHKAAVAGVPMHKLQDHMGHRDIATTQRHYARIEVEDRREWMDSVSNRLFAATVPAPAAPLLTA